MKKLLTKKTALGIAFVVAPLTIGGILLATKGVKKLTEYVKNRKTSDAVIIEDEEDINDEREVG